MSQSAGYIMKQALEVKKKYKKHSATAKAVKSERMKQEYASGSRVSATKGKSVRLMTDPKVWEERNRKISETRKQRFASGEIVQSSKGKKYEDMFDLETVARLKAGISKSKSGANAPMANLESREKMRQSVIRSQATRKVSQPKYPCSGYREDIGHYVRSRWEANVCRILNYLNKPYTYESSRFEVQDRKGVSMIYLPDLHIEGTNIFIEIKGTHYLGSNKHLLFAEQYPQYKLGLIDFRTYKALRRKYKSKIPNWDDHNLNDYTVEARSKVL